ncbi:TonB-linked SusC/RagA family outer membrane protein [Lewinella aquimaris]|uniref:TonB-linked SusC/RagA family outer membrane protein n=2 Tax=Neolewinella aquimaris TaxID=1835722 RepID=A0A840E2C7_9BACT|nr:TonB-linked SusC/RagA family outer membrane protein [Neolewinella aquimaris]
MLLAFCCLVGTAGAHGSIRGTVTSEENEPLIGVSVVQLGTNNGTVTDLDGNYQLNLIEGSKTVQFSYTGFATQEVEVGALTVIDVVLGTNAELLDEIVVIGYGTERKRDVLGSIASVDEEAITQTTPVNAFDAIQGRLSGVQISSNGGPGSGSEIRIRGTSTLGGGVDPLYVVDGQQLENIDNLNPNDIASIEVLKDGASAAIYGSKSANGVVIITTKQGTQGKTNLEINHSTGVSQVSSLIPVSNTRQRVLFEQQRSGGVGSGTDTDSLSARFQQEVDIQDLLIRTGVRNQTGLSVSGGGENSRFYWNTGYLSEDGIILNSDYSRINTSLKVDFDFNTFISAGTRINASYEKQGGLNENTVFRQLSERPAYLPVRDGNGELFPEVFGRQNPLAEALETVNDDRNFRSTLFSYVELKLLPELAFRSTLGVNYRQRKRNIFEPTITQRQGNPATGREQQILDYDLQQENYLTYKKKFGNHNLSLLAGMQTQRWNNEFSEIRAVSFASDLIQTFNNVAELNTSATRTLQNRHALLSYFGRMSYNYRGKYLLAGTLRRDGSSRFGDNRKYGNFPSASVGWRISAEPFMEGIRGVVSDLKLRAAYAITGNERIGDYDSQLLYSPGFIYNGVNGVAPTQLSNPDLGWESTEQTNFGLDLELLEGRFTTTLDFYTKTTDDLLYEVPLPEETGFSIVQKNVGSVENKGVELTIGGTPLKLGDFRWYTSFNIATNKNKVLSLADPDGFESGPFKIEVGESLGNIYGFTNLGVFAYDESNAFTDDGTLLTPVFDADGAFTNYTLNGQTYTGEVNQLRAAGRTLGGGDVIWDDLNGDFNIDNTNDRSVIGNGLPKYFGGFFNEFTYRSLSFSFLFDYNFGNDIYRNYDDRRNTATSFGATPHPDRIEGAWLEQGDVVEYPSLDRRRSQNRIGVDSYYLSDADFIKLRNVRLTYELPTNIVNRLNWLSGVSVNLSVNNPITWTNYEGYNPELGSRGSALQPGIDNLRYPNRTEYIFGIKVRL